MTLAVIATTWSILEIMVQVIMALVALAIGGCIAGIILCTGLLILIHCVRWVSDRVL